MGPIGCLGDTCTPCGKCDQRCGLSTQADCWSGDLSLTNRWSEVEIETSQSLDKQCKNMHLGPT